MRIKRLVLTAYGQCRDVGFDIGDGVTVVLGANEAGKSTSLDALSDLLWGIPRGSSRATEFTRQQLRIDAVIADDHELRTIVRRATGLFAEDLVTQISPAWNPNGRLDARWWRTRLGIDHADLRKGGNELFTGTGDLADIIFAVREGHSAREVLKELTDQADKLFKPDGRARRVELRLAAEEYEQAVTDRDGRLTRAGEVVEQREIVGQLAAKRRRLRDDATKTSQALKLADENRRVIHSVLALHRASAELEVVDSEGDRLTEDELSEHDNACAQSRSAGELITKLDNEIAAKAQSIRALSVNDELLDDRATFNRLQPDVTARIEDLRRAGDEFGAAVAEAVSELRQQLRNLGVEVVADDLDTALDTVRIREDHAATLDDLADQLECLEQKRQEARDECDRAVTELLARGIAVEIASSAAPDQEAIGRLRKALADERIRETTAETLLTEATDAVVALDADPSDPCAAVGTLTHAAVVEARAGRDAQWSNIRRSWVTGDLPGSGDRVDIAVEFDRSLSDADRVADDEAAERSRIAALDARTEAHVEGLETARRKQRLAVEQLGAVVADRLRAEQDWDAAWSGLGIASSPCVDDSSTVAEWLSTAHVERARELSAVGQIAEINERWCAAAELTGLDGAMTTAAWRKRTEVLEHIDAVQAQRAKNQEREAQARAKWDEFVIEAAMILQRHGALDAGQEVSAGTIEQGFAKLGRQLDAAAEASAKRVTYREQIDEKHVEREDAERARQDALEALQRISEVHSVGTEQDLEMLAERARRAAEPLERKRESEMAIRNGLDSSSEFPRVVERLAGLDETAVEQAVDDVRISDEEAHRAAEHALSEYTTAHDHLMQLEEAAGAADAEAAVASRQAEVARLTEAWAILTLQRILLEDVLDSLASGDTRPLLDHAGRLLEQLTEGRWVALRAENDGTSRTLSVIRADNTPRHTSELSDGTADQVFFALRLAAVAELHKERMEAGEAALPLVLDDVLVAFDEARVRSALKILESLAPDLQIIVFTHHQHVAEEAAEFAQIKVSQLPAAASIAESLDGDLVRAQAQRGAAMS